MSKSKKKSIFERVFGKTTFIELIATIFVAIFLSQISDWIKLLIDNTILHFVVSCLVILLIILIMNKIRETKTKNRMENMKFVPSKNDKPRPVKGLILLISTFSPRAFAMKRDNPQKAILENKEKFEELVEHILNTEIKNLSQNDFDNINFLHSNMRPQLNAIKFHAEKDELQEIWLITSKDKNSILAGKLLQKYIKLTYGEKIKLKDDKNVFSVDEWDYKEIWKIGEKIFTKGGYSKDALIADITGGLKLMSIGLAISCIPKGRKMQYIHAERDSQGEPLKQGEIDPMVINVNPILYPEEEMSDD